MNKELLKEVNDVQDEISQAMSILGGLEPETVKHVSILLNKILAYGERG